jgi:hypothetical protein
MKQSAVGYRNTNRAFPLRRDDIAVIAGEVIMSKVVLDISRENSATEGAVRQELISPHPMRPQNHMQGRPHPQAESQAQARGRQQRPR